MTYNITKIADELIKTALGEAYYGNSLYVALDFPFLTEEHKRCLHRYLHGSYMKTDHVMLQDIANVIIEKGKELCVYPITGSRAQATPISSQIMTMERMISERDDEIYKLQDQLTRYRAVMEMAAEALDNWFDPKAEKALTALRECLKEEK